MCLVGWINREQQAVNEYLSEEICVLKEHVDPKGLRFTDDQRAPLARKTKKLKFGRLWVPQTSSQMSENLRVGDQSIAAVD